MKLHVMSDLHMEGCKYDLPKTDADVILIAGDSGTGKVNPQPIFKLWAFDHNKPVIWIAGNHEFYNGTFPTDAQKFKERNSKMCRFLQDSTWEYNNVRFIGMTLWTDFFLYGEPNFDEIEWYLNDYVVIHKPDYQTFKPRDAEAAHYQSLEYLQRKLNEPFDGKTVVITHHAPSPRSIAPEWQNNETNVCFVSNLEYLMGPKIDLWLHGHVHNNFDYEINGTRVVCNPRGYIRKSGIENENFNPNLVVEI